MRPQPVISNCKFSIFNSLFLFAASAKNDIDRTPPINQKKGTKFISSGDFKNTRRGRR